MQHQTFTQRVNSIKTIAKNWNTSTTMELEGRTGLTIANIYSVVAKLRKEGFTLNKRSGYGAFKQAVSELKEEGE